MAETAADIKTTMDAMADYIDRLYFTAKWHGKTCAMLASGPGLPIWAEVRWRAATVLTSPYKQPVVAGVGGGNAKCAYVDDITLASPTWTENNTGLGAATNVGPLKINGWDIDLGYLLIDGKIWKNPAIRNAGTWSAILDSTIANGITGYGGTVTGFDISEATQGSVYAAVVDTQNSIWCLYSTDKGVTWAGTKVYNGNAYSGSASIVAGQHVAGRLYLTLKALGASNYYAYTSTNGGASWSSAVDLGPQGDQATLFMPFDTLDDTECFACFGGPYNAIERTTNGGSSWSSFASDGVHQRRFARDYSNDAFYMSSVWSPGYSQWFNYGYTSTDRGLTWTQQGRISPYTKSLLDVTFSITGSYIACGYGQVQSSPDGNTWTDRTGNLNTGYNWSAICNNVPLPPKRRLALGQYHGDGELNVHSAISGQSAAPAWLGAAVDTATANSFELGIDDVGGVTYKAPPAKASRAYATTGVTYKIEDITTDPVVSGDDIIDVYIGATKIISDLKNTNKLNWENTTVQTTDANKNHLRALDYPARHCFDLGRIVYLARGDTTKAGNFLNSEQESGFLKNLYHVLYGHLDNDYDDYYQWALETQNGRLGMVAYKDMELDMLGDKTTTLPNTTLLTGVADDGIYFYPHESKTRGRVPWVVVLPTGWVVPVTLKGWWLLFEVSTRVTTYLKIQWATHMLKKHGDPYAKYTHPAAAWFPGFGQTISAVDVADQAISEWDEYKGLGAPSALVDNPYHLSYVFGNERCNGFTTPQFAIFWTLLGYGCGIPKYQPYADAAISQIRKIIWGCAPNDTHAKGIVQGVEYTRPEHQGGAIPVFSEYAVGDSGTSSGGNSTTTLNDTTKAWTANQWAGKAVKITGGTGSGQQRSVSSNTATQLTVGTAWTTTPDATSVYSVGTLRLGHAGKGVLDQLFDTVTFWEPKLPVWLPDAWRAAVKDWDGLRQQPNDADVIPTTMEATTLCYMAMRIYLAYKYNEAYPAGTWANGLDMVSGFCSGKVTAGGSPVSGATVLLVDGTQTANPQDLTGYIAQTTTDANGTWVLPYFATGNKTIYVVKSGYKHVYKTYNFLQPDQNVVFPEAALTV